MAHERARPATVNSFALPGAAGLMAIAIFALDTFVLLPGAVAVLYVIVVLLSVNFLRWRGVLLVALGCAVLTVLSYLLQHGLSYIGEPFVRLLVSLSAIGATAFLALQSQSVTEVAHGQARLLDLTHDTIFVRDMNNVITYWNQGAELLYGWSKAEAIGQSSHQLMQTIFPVPLEEINVELLSSGRWEGELVHARREGPPLVVASRWSLQRDGRGRPLTILETNNDITDRKHAEEELRRSQVYLTEAQRLGHTGSWAIDVANRRGIHSSAEHHRLFGFDPAEGMPGWEEWERRIHAEDRERAMGTFARGMRERVDIDMEYRIVLPDGVIRYVQAVGHPVFSAAGDLVEFVGTSIDVTERKKADDALRRSEAYLAEAQRLSRTGSFGWAVSTGTIFWSDETFRIFGYDKAAFATPDMIVQRVHPDDLAFVRRMMESASHDRKDLDFEHRLLMPDGSVKHLRVVGRAVPDASGGVEFAGAVMDITGQKQAEEALRDSEQRFRDYAETASDWLWETGPDHRFTHLSEQLEAIGVIPALRMGLTRWDFATDVDEEPDKWRLHIATLEARRPFRGFVFRVAATDGSTHYISASGKPVFDPAGSFVGYRGVGSDVTVAVRAEQAEDALRKTQAELAHVARVMTLGELTASIAHEVNQPLAAIVTNGEVCLRWLDREVPDLGEVREGLGDMISSGRRAGEIVRRLRALAQKEETQKQAVNLNEAIGEVIPLVQQEAISHEVSLRLELAPALPAVLGDRVQLQQVILNLIVNGMEAMADVSGRPRELVVRSQLDAGGLVLVAIEDSGIGIDPDNAKQLFNAFFTTKTSGMGMGLSICRSIVENHGGRLWASRNAGPGATFQFALQSHQEARP